MKTSKHIDKLSEAFAVAQGNFYPPAKNKKANYGMYVDLAAVIEATRVSLRNAGLCISQNPTFKDGRVIVVTRIMDKSGNILWTDEGHDENK